MINTISPSVYGNIIRMVTPTPPMEVDERLREAALRGDVDFLRECVASNKPNEYYLTVFPKCHRKDLGCGNIFHLAAWAQQEKFIRAAAVDDDKLLGMEVIQQLLCQPGSESNKGNPIHMAAAKGNVEIVKMFLNAFNSSSSSTSSSDVTTPPWLLTDEKGQNPCHTALDNGKEECGLEILKMDMESLSNMHDEYGCSLLAIAVLGGHYKAAMQILMSSTHSFSSSGQNGFHALHGVPLTFSPGEGQEICRRLLEKMPELITKSSEIGLSIFHQWAKFGKIWPFECFLNASDVIQDVTGKFVDLISTIDVDGMNPLHMLSKIKRPHNIEIVQLWKLLIDTYRTAQASSSISTERQFPWLVQDLKEKTPLDYAIAQEHEELSTKILSEDKNSLTYAAKDVLFMAIENRLHEVPLKILEIVDERKDLTHLLINQENQTALHLAPKCNEVFVERLLEGHPELLGKVDSSSNTILHHWVKIGQVWPFECIFKRKKISVQQRNQLIFQLQDSNDKFDTPLHVAATCTYPAIQQVVQLLLDAFQELFFIDLQFLKSICGEKNIDGEGPLHLAIRCQQDQSLALYLLSFWQHDHMEELLDLYTPQQHKILFLAIEKNFSEVVKMILGRLDKASWAKYVKDSSNGQNVLHVASSCTDKELGKWLVEKAHEFITEPDMTGITPLGQASDIGATWIIEAMLEKDGLAFNKAPLAWVGACEKGNISVIQAFIEYCPEKFSDHCFEHQDSPLHHIKLRNIVRYEEFIKMRHMKDLINLKDSKGATPLHKAIENRNIMLVEVLLNMDNIKYNIKNEEGKTARDLLAQLCKKDQKWDQMCRSVGFDPNLTTTYFQQKTNLLEVRNTLSVVAALLATITFTAGFTFPGGFDQNNGEAMLADKAAFHVFLISDTLALFFSMLVLICLMWSMVFEPNQSLFLIDRSVRLIKAAIYLTLLAFVTGVYVVVSPKSLWAAIIIIIAMCSLVGISISRTVMYQVFAFIDSFAKKECTDPMHLMEMGILRLGNHGEISNQDRPSINEPNEHLE